MTKKRKKAKPVRAWGIKVLKDFNGKPLKQPWIFIGGIQEYRREVAESFSYDYETDEIIRVEIREV